MSLLKNLIIITTGHLLCSLAFLLCMFAIFILEIMCYGFNYWYRHDLILWYSIYTFVIIVPLFVIKLINKYSYKFCILLLKKLTCLQIFIALINYLWIMATILLLYNSYIEIVIEQSDYDEPSLSHNMEIIFSVIFEFYSLCIFIFIFSYNNMEKYIDEYKENMFIKYILNLSDYSLVNNELV
jgi:hypothetical protein